MSYQTSIILLCHRLKFTVHHTANCETAHMALFSKCAPNGAILQYNKQLLGEVEHDIENYQNRGLCYLPKPKAEADNTETRF